MGFKMADIKVILLNHSHVDQSGAAAELHKRTGAQVMAGFAEVPYLQRGIHAQSPFLAPAGPGPRYPAVTVDRALFDGDVVQVGPLRVTAFLSPGPQSIVDQLALHGARRRQGLSRPRVLLLGIP